MTLKPNERMERAEQILLSLSKFEFISTTQLQKLHRLGGVRNTRRILSNLSEYVNICKSGMENVYYLNRAGYDFLDIQKQPKKLNNIDHYLMRTNFFLYLDRPMNWKHEVLTTVGDFSVKPDVLFYRQKQYAFVEIDNEQKMSNNRLKVEKYKKIFASGIFQEQKGYFPTIHWLTKYESRKKKLLALCEGLPSQVFTLEEIK